ncbi:MAG: Zn-ribbon domain-containing OB-fold protein [Candidatus Jordarchaeum sp.]|uniref:Zn-ribbon domain-containing OB-fold protein n=1 Tax=Candidatus Jordarchaeum sp. TaxID=2823881 RepID=UPI00404A1DB5
MSKHRLFKEGIFKEGSLESGNPILVGSKCKSCGQIYFPKKRVCPECMTIDEVDEVELSRRGKIYSYTIAYVGPLEYAPYAFGFVELPEGISIFTHFTDCEPFEEKLKIDMEVELTSGKITTDEDGTEVIGWKFRPVKEG